MSRVAAPSPLGELLVAVANPLQCDGKGFRCRKKGLAKILKGAPGMAAAPARICRRE
jgi:hypothetical protein